MNTATKSKPWYKEDPRQAKSKAAGLNKKYGMYDYSQDERQLYLAELRDFFKKLSLPLGRSLIIGCNSGGESSFIQRRSTSIFGVDLAKDALENSRGTGIIPILADAEKLPFIDGYFSTCLALRALYSSHTRLDKAVAEATRVLKKGGVLVTSIPNAYLHNGVIAYGMYDYSKKIIDPAVPKKYLKDTISILKRLGYQNIQVAPLGPFGAEIFIVARKS